MLLKGYDLEIFRSKCNSSAERVQCFAHLHEDVSEVLPYLNTVLGPGMFTEDPPALMFKNYGKLITVHARMIAVNALENGQEADKIVSWLQREINTAWRKRWEIKPCRKSWDQPLLFEVFKLLPRTNCQACGLKTCMVFASRVIEGSMGQEGCPTIDPVSKEALKTYLSKFRFG